MLADELDQYKGKENSYVKENIREIQDLYIREENEEEKNRVEDEEVITDEVENLLKHMKFI